MAKQVYKIPASLDASYLDVEISLQNKDGIGKILSLKVIVAWLASILLLAFMIFRTPLGYGTFLQKLLFAILWIWWSFSLFSEDKTHRMKFLNLASLVNYLMPGARRLSTRRTDPAIKFRNLVGIETIEDNGRILFLDGTWGYMYRVVGSASLFLFDADRKAILDRVDGFYRKMERDCDLIWITTKEPQKVHRQVRHAKELRDNLHSSSPGLKALADERIQVLEDDIGSHYRSIHQYLIIKADNKEALRTGFSILKSEVENSSHMIKQCQALVSPSQVTDALKIIYNAE